MIKRMLSLASQNLRVKTLVLTMLLVIGAVVGANGLGLLSTNRLIASNQSRTVELLASSLGAAAELPLAVGDADEVSRIVTRFVDLHPGLLFIEVDADSLPESVAAARDAEALEAFRNECLDPNTATVFRSQVSVEVGGDEDLFGFEDEPTSQGLREGEASGGAAKIVIAVSARQRAAAQEAALQNAIASAGLIAAISMPLAFVAATTIVRRLGGLAEAAERISNGEFDRSLQDPSSDEIGRLVGAFDRMRVAVRERDERERLRQEQLKEARDSAQLANSAKSQFLAHMSHEIRTPLNGVIGMLDLLELTQVDSKQSRYMNIARSSADSLLSLINDILDFSKIEAGHMELEQTDFGVREIFETAAEMLGPKASEKGIELLCHVSSDVPSRGIGDPNKLRQMVVNLTNNAVKFTSSGEIVIRVSVVEDEGENLLCRVSVADTGIGVPADRRDRLFKAFSQVDASTTRRFGGTGLGLAICKSFAELMGGEIGIDPDREVGSEFWFTFRMEKSDEADQDAPEAIDSLVGIRTLIIDDNPTNREILREALGRWGAVVSEADCGPAALAALRAEPADSATQLIILDMQMPDMDGAQVADAIGSDPLIKRPCIVMLTSMHHSAQASDLKNLGISACLQKPAKLSVLFETLRDALGGARLTLRSKPAGPWMGSSLRGTRVLVAEDNEVNRIVVRELLMTAGIECEIVENGKEAVDRFDPKRYDAILMDCEMPVMDGFEATRAIREDPKGRTIPIIALTANAVRGDRERCLAAGMSEYVTKPIEPARLFGALEKLRADDIVEHAGLPRAGDGGPEVPGESQAASSETLGTSSMDIPSALSRCGGNGEVLLMTLDVFEKQMQSTIVQLEDASRDAEFDTLASVAHALKGSAGNLGVERVYEQASVLEAAAGTMEIAEIEQELDALLGEAQNFLTQLPEIRAKVEESV